MINAVAVDRVTLVHRVVTKDCGSVDPVTLCTDVVGESVELHRTNNPHSGHVVEERSRPPFESLGGLW
jgi:hypothetical protein